jgi:enoyl-CoA hydratase/carnithine racemase
MRVRVERNGPAAVVTLDDPATRNALDPELANEIRVAIEEVGGDPAVRGIVLTGLLSSAGRSSTAPTRP